MPSIIRHHRYDSSTAQRNPFSLTSRMTESGLNRCPSTRSILSQSSRSKFIFVSGKCRHNRVTRLLASVASCTFVLNTSIICGLFVPKAGRCATIFFSCLTQHGILKKFCFRLATHHKNAYVPAYKRGAKPTICGVGCDSALP